LFFRGNGKLGEGIHTWSLPAGGEHCPGRTALCERLCYARGGRFALPAVRLLLEENLDAALDESFAARAVAEIRRRGIHTLRVHVSGDFFSPDYAATWLGIARRCRRTTFYAYTRSWRVPAVRPVLEQLARLPNVRLWYSTDAETGVPAFIPRGVRLAFLQHEDTDVPDGAGVVFRIRRLRARPAGRFGLRLVCPTERPQRKDVTCTSCGRCWQ
jgi:hypothetical protein